MEEIKPAIDELVRLISAIDFDEMDMAAIRSSLTAAINNSALGVLNCDIVQRFTFDIFAWTIAHCAVGNVPKLHVEAKRNDRITEAAYHATFRSFELVMQQLRQPNANRYFSAKRTTKSLCRRILSHFDSFCKDLLIANTSDAINMRSDMLTAAELAKEFIRQQKDQIQFPEDEIYNYDGRILQYLILQLSRNVGFEDTGSNMQYASQSLVNNLVGLAGDLTKIEERLKGTLRKLEIISILGMGGIGKTTLATRVYEDQKIKSIFHVRAWATVSQEYNERNVLLGLLQSIAPLPEEVLKEDKEQLAERLYRRLKGWRFFIVIDDIWTIKAWDLIKLCFPDDSNGSRIVLTTRVTEVASHVNPENPPHFMNFLNPEDSWELLRIQVYGKEAWPPHLVSAGKYIAEKCQGLPLAIKVVAGHLSNIERTQECWEEVANRVGLAAEVTQIDSLLNILSMSYNDLPHHLKACFLSMVTFPKNSDISTGKLIRMWSATGFLPSKLPNSMEEVTKEQVAMKCLEDLVGRNLIMVKKRRFDGEAKVCGVHDLLWDLSMREVRKEGNLVFGDTSLCPSYFNTSDGMRYAMGLTRTLLYFDQSFELDCPLSSAGFQPLRVLDILNQFFDQFPNEITDLVNLRYLALATCDNIPGSVSKLCYLETLINNHERAGSILPKEIWLLACLRHLQIGTYTYLAEPTFAESEGICGVLALPDLQTISNLSVSSCTKEVFLKIPNLKKLGIHETGDEDEEDDQLLFSSLNNLAHLHQLENLKLCCNPELGRRRRIPDWNSFLTNIKQLTLIRSNLPWSEMKALAMLQNLEVLKLKENAFTGYEWEMEEEEFLHLKFLLLESVELWLWKAEADNFPALRCLVINDCDVNGIPIGMGQISTLQLIDLDFISSVTTYSAKEIERERKDMGNENFMVRIGHIMPEQQLISFVATFAYMTLQLKMQRAKKGRRERKEKGIVRKTQVLAVDCASNSLLEAVTEE